MFMYANSGQNKLNVNEKKLTPFYIREKNLVSRQFMSMCSSNKTVSIKKVFVCDSVDHICLGHQACIDIHILPPCYTYKMSTTEEKSKVQKVDLVLTKQPSTLLYPATAENVSKLKQDLIDSFRDTAFINSGPFPSMDTPPAHIHLKPDAI